MGDERRACGHRALPLAVSQRARWEWLAGWLAARCERGGGGRARHAALGRTALPPLSLDRLRLLREIGPAPNDNCVSCLTGRLHGPIVGPTGRSDPGYVRLSVRPVGQTVGQTVAEPPT